MYDHTNAKGTWVDPFFMLPIWRHFLHLRTCIDKLHSVFIKINIKLLKFLFTLYNYTLLSEELRKCFHSCVCALTTAASLICCFLLVGKYGMGSYKTVLGIGNAPRTWCESRDHLVWFSSDIRLVFLKLHFVNKWTYF